MTIAEKVAQEVVKHEDKSEANSDLFRQKEFYARMMAEGLIKKQEYTAPVLDTAGRRMYQLSLPNKSSQDT